MINSDRLLFILQKLYGSSTAVSTLQSLNAKVDNYRQKIAAQSSIGVNLTEQDVMLITYGNQVREDGIPPLRALADFCLRHLEGTVNCLHVLPFYPFSSDDGFSVKDFRQVSPELGTWEDIGWLKANFHLMFDAVINHASAQGGWFKAFLRNEEPYRDYFIVVDKDVDLSKVVRPRALPLLHSFGEPPDDQLIWTTFSADQVDLNYRSPQVLLEIIDLLLYYISMGADFIRLDAVAYLWKEIGTPCIHLPQTHLVIQLFRAVLDDVTPQVKLITETNVPHKDNISYFGDGHNEAQLVYNFALPPLVLHTFYTGSAGQLSKWAGSINPPSGQVTFLNFLASHDGIGLNPVREILSDQAIDAMTQRVLMNGGLVSYKQNSDGTKSPYELNINYFDALSNPGRHESLEIQVDRFMAAQVIMLSLAGMPGIYFHSIFGSRGWLAGVEKTGNNRAINRQRFTVEEIERDLVDASSLRHKVFARYQALLRARMASQAFHPYGAQTILEYDDAVFAIVRRSPQAAETVLCIINVTDRSQTISLDLGNIFGFIHKEVDIVDLISGQRLLYEQTNSTLRLLPYQSCWLARKQDKATGH